MHVLASDLGSDRLALGLRAPEKLDIAILLEERFALHAYLCLDFLTTGWLLQVRAHGSEMPKHNLDSKWLNIECKRLIRTTVINPMMRFHSDASDDVSPSFLSTSQPLHCPIPISNVSMDCSLRSWKFMIASDVPASYNVAAHYNVCACCKFRTPSIIPAPAAAKLQPLPHSTDAVAKDAKCPLTSKAVPGMDVRCAGA